jgi:Tol biopolymer transport system component
MKRTCLSTAVLCLAACGTPSGQLRLVPLGEPVAESDVVPGAVAVWVADDGTETVLASGAPVRWASVDPAGRRVATVGMDGSLLLTRIGGPAVQVASGVTEAPSFDPSGSGALLVSMRIPGEEGTALVIVEADGSTRTVVGAGCHNERAAFSPDGTRIAFFSDASSVPAVWIAPVSGSWRRQMTNLGMRREPGRKPEGYLAPPLRGALAWTSSGIEYDSRDGAVLIGPGGGVTLDGREVAP